MDKAREYTLAAALRAGSWLFAFAFFLSFLFNVLLLTGPLFMLLIYDRVLASQSEETLVALFILVVMLVIITGLLDYSRRRLMARFGAQFQERLERQIFSSTAKDKFFVAGKNKPASGLNELDSLRGFFHSYAFITIFDFVWTPMFLAVIFAFSWLLGWVCVAGVALLVLLSLVRAFAAKSRQERAKKAGGRIADLKDIMRFSSDVIRGQQMATGFKTRWLEARKNSRDKSIELKDCTAWFDITSRQIRMLSRYSVLAVGAYLAVNGKLSIGAMVASSFLVLRVLTPVESFLNQLPQISLAISNWRNLKRILQAKTPPILHDGEDDLAPNLSLTTVYSRSASTKKNALFGINLEVSQGQLIQIQGKTGSGKTLLAETIIGTWPKNAGTILCGGANMDLLGSRHLGDFFGYVPETIEFVKGTIKENVARLAPHVDLDKVYKAAERAGVHDQIIALPDGYDTEVGDAETKLSKGMKHQIALARALYGEPKVLVFDEPDVTLRVALSGKLATTFDELRTRGCAIVILTRKALTLQNCDKLYILDNGRLRPHKTGREGTGPDIKPAKNNVTELVRG